MTVRPQIMLCESFSLGMNDLSLTKLTEGEINQRSQNLSQTLFAIEKREIYIYII